MIGPFFCVQLTLAVLYNNFSTSNDPSTHSSKAKGSTHQSVLRYGGTFTEVAREDDDEKERKEAAAEAARIAMLARQAQSDNAKGGLTADRLAAVPLVSRRPGSAPDAGTRS